MFPAEDKYSQVVLGLQLNSLKQWLRGKQPVWNLDFVGIPKRGHAIHFHDDSTGSLVSRTWILEFVQEVTLV